MKYATSIRYGGQLIEAGESDYDDYKRLGLCCPECKSPVFLRKPSGRAASHFAHFKASDPAIVRLCELRVSSYSQKDLKRRATQSRNQRLRLLQRWFWDIYLNHAFRDGSTKQLIQQANLLERIKEQFPVAEYCQYFRKLVSVQDVQQALNESIFPMAAEELQSDRVRLLREKIAKVEINLHRLVCSEIINFLKVRRNLPLLEKVIACSFLMVQFSSIAQNEMAAGNKWIPLTNAVVVLCMIPWGEEFQKLDKTNVG